MVFIHSSLFLTVTIVLSNKVNSLESRSKMFPKISLSSDGYNFVQGANFFAFDAYKVLLEPEENLIFSPFSLYTVLSMLYMMANGKTATQMHKVLHMPPDINLLGSGFRDIEKYRQRDSLKMGNRIFLQEDFSIKETLKNNLLTYFSSIPVKLDFKNPKNATNIINDWISSETNNTILNLLNPDGISDDTRMMLVSTLYMYEKWEHPFEREDTVSKPFQLLDNSFVNVSMMTTEKKFLYAYLKDLDAAIVSLPYAGGLTSLVILVPVQYNGLAQLQKKIINLGSMDTIFDKLKLMNVVVTIPKFKFKKMLNLKEALQQIGLTDIFYEGKADFTNGVNNEELVVGKVAQSAYIQVNEEGTKAAAATALEISERSFSDFQTPHINANHPFMFLIVDQTKSIQFIGHYTNPMKL